MAIEKEQIQVAEKIQSVHKEVMDMMNWSEEFTWQWMGAPMEELDMNSPAGLLIMKKEDTLNSFLNGMKIAIKTKENGRLS